MLFSLVFATSVGGVYESRPHNLASANKPSASVRGPPFARLSAETIGTRSTVKRIRWTAYRDAKGEGRAGRWSVWALLDGHLDGGRRYLI